MIIVITGAGKGIGKAIAERFGLDDEHTLFLCARNISSLQNVAESIMQDNPGTTVHIKSCDVQNKAQLQEFADYIMSFGQAVDVLINNAGSFVPGSVYNEPEGNIEKMLSVNFLSAYYFTRMLLPSMLKQHSGSIFNICSTAALKAYDNGGSYSISKHALSGFTRNLREELKPMGIKVCGVYPGATMTDSWAGAGIDPQRILEADDIAKLIHAATLLSPQAVVEDIILRPQLGDL